MCAENNPAIKKAVAVLRNLSEDEENRMIAKQIEKERRDCVAEIKLGHEKGHEKGFAEGIEKGIEQASVEIAKSMLKNNLSIEVISNCTNLTIDTILSIQSELQVS